MTASGLGGRPANPRPVTAAVLDLVTEVVGTERVAWMRSAADIAAAADGAVCVVDPEPNYWSVTAVLRAWSSGVTERLPVLVEHAGWPTAYRDLYPDPASLPTDAVHPYTTSFGVRPGSPEPLGDGVRGEPGAAWAIEDGGPRNGVRRAVDDFVAAEPDLDLLVIPGDPGIAVIWPTRAAFAAVLADRLRLACLEGGVADAFEEQRLALIDRIVMLEAERAAAGDAGPRLRNENARLRARVAALEGALDEIASEADPRSGPA